MTKTYKNPPLLEAVCEFRFELSSEYSKEQIATFYEKIKGDFSLQKKGKVHQFQFKIEPDKTTKENQKSINQDFHEFEQYLSSDEKYSVQLDGGRVSIHRVKPYHSWNEFLPLIQKVYHSYIETFSPKQLARIGMRYVNEVTLPLDGFSFSEYFTINASMPSLEESTQKSIFLGSIFERDGGRDAIKVQFAEKQSAEFSTNRIFVLDFDYFLVKSLASFDDIDKWLNKAHTDIENVFEGISTKKTKQLFNK